MMGDGWKMGSTVINGCSMQYVMGDSSTKDLDPSPGPPKPNLRKFEVFLEGAVAKQKKTGRGG